MISVVTFETIQSKKKFTVLVGLLIVLITDLPVVAAWFSPLFRTQEGYKDVVVYIVSVQAAIYIALTVSTVLLVIKLRRIEETVKTLSF